MAQRTSRLSGFYRLGADERVESVTAQLDGEGALLRALLDAGPLPLLALTRPAVALGSLGGIS